MMRSFIEVAFSKPGLLRLLYQTLLQQREGSFVLLLLPFALQ
jgi:hypothetical protein